MKKTHSEAQRANGKKGKAKSPWSKLPACETQRAFEVNRVYREKKDEKKSA